MNTDNIDPAFFIAWGTPVKVKPVVLVDIFGLWGAMVAMDFRQHPERSWTGRLLISTAGVITWIIADFGHALAHIHSARIAGAPMDEIRITAEMPRTIYYDNDVPPQAHRMRALGGPIYSVFGLITSLLMRVFMPRDSVAHEIAGYSSLGHGLILVGSLAPIPIVDGGVILKWTLVEIGQTEEKADQIVKKAGLITGAAAIGAGVGLATRGRWLPAMGLLATGAVAIAADIGKIR